MGAVLYGARGIAAHLYDRVSPGDCKRFEAQIGDPKFQSTWEGLAALMGFRAWGYRFTPTAPVEYRSDNTGVLGAVRARAAPDPGLNAIMQRSRFRPSCEDAPGHPNIGLLGCWGALVGSSLQTVIL